MDINTAVNTIIETVGSWNGITAEPHRFGGKEFKLGNVEIGHIHRHGMVDIPFTVAIREQLVAEGRAELHHLLQESGWITFYLRSEADVENAIWLYRLSYLQKGRRRQKDQDWQPIVASLQLSPALSQIVMK